MRTTAVPIVAVLMLAGLCGCNSVNTAGSEKWKYLFDSKTLDGWVRRGGEAAYHVENGAIVGTTGAINTPNTFLCTEKNYGDFILELEIKVDPKLNSGIQIRSQSLPEYKSGRVHGYQVEVDPSKRSWTGAIYDEGRRKWELNKKSKRPIEQNESGRKAFKAGQWNHLRIEAIGPSIKTWVNGVPVADVEDSMTPKGFIGLQVHSIKTPVALQIRWRNIRIQNLDSN